MKGAHTSPLRSLLATLWLVFVLSLCVYLIATIQRGFPFDTSIIALLPSQSQQPLIDKSSDRLTSGFSNSMIFVLGAPVEERSEVTEAARRFTRSLTDSGAFVQVSQNLPRFELREVLASYQAYRYQLLDNKFRSLANQGKVKDIVDSAITGIYSPFTLPRLLSFSKDPLNFFGRWLNSLPTPPKPQADVEGIFVLKEGFFYRVIFAEFTGDAFDLAVQKNILPIVRDAARELGTGEVSLLRSGLIFHAAAGAQQAIFELSTIGLGSLAGIALLLLILFGRFYVLAIAALPIAVGCFVALAVCIFFLGKVHMITLAFGASLVGVSVDYIMHYLCAQSADHNGLSIFPALCLGLISSVIAYCSFAFTPFPGLQQMALFAVVGLTAAWLTVVLWLPVIFVQNPAMQSRFTVVRHVDALDRFRDRVTFRFLPQITVIPMLLLAMLLGFVGEIEDDLRLLNTSPPEMLHDEQRVQQLLKAPAVGQYFLVRGDNHQEILRREEALRIELDKLLSANTLRSYQAVSTYLPSLARQAQNTQAIRNIYRSPEGLRDYAERLQIPAKDVVHVIDQFELSSQRTLHYNEWQNWPPGQLLSNLLIMGPDGRSIAASVIVVNGDLNQEVLQLLESFAQGRPGVSFVNRPQAISALLGEYREQVSVWLVVVYLLIGFVLAWRFHWRSVLVVITPALATLAAMGVLALIGQPLTLFHLLASVLVLGIGLDMGIFLHESKGASHAVLAVGASALTTILAFGLLGLSKTPVLHFFGQMALLGISFSWVLAMAFNSFYYKVKATHGL